MKNDFITSDRDKMTITVHLASGDLVIDKKDIDISYFSGGPGGQNVNRNMNGVRLIYRIPDTHRMNSLKTRQLIAKSINERSKERNLSDAFDQLVHRVRRYFYVQPDRKKTKVPKKAKKKRRRNKKMQSLKKQGRKKITNEL